MKISSQQANLIAKSGNVELLNKMMANGNVVNLLTKEEAGLLRRTSDEEQKKNICPSAGLVFVHSLGQEQEAPQIAFTAPSTGDMYHIYNMEYDKPIEVLMDELTKYAKGMNINKNRLRFAVENIDKDYLVKYESQYNEALRQLLTEDDLVSMMTEADASYYYEEQEREEEEEEEEEGLEAYGLSGFSF